MQKFIKKTTILTLILVILSLLLYFLAPPRYFSFTLPYLIGFFYVINLLIFYYMQKAANHLKKTRFISTFMLVTTAKLLISLTVILIFSFSMPHEAVSFILSFFVLYLVYTSFEVVSILRLTKNN